MGEETFKRAIGKIAKEKSEKSRHQTAGLRLVVRRYEDRMLFDPPCHPFVCFPNREHAFAGQRIADSQSDGAGLLTK
jgi:hypothetical protein